MNDRIMMRRILCIAILLLGIGMASGHAQGRQKVTVELKNATLRQVFRSIEKQTTYRFSYRNAIIDDKHDITISKRDVNVDRRVGRGVAGQRSGLYHCFGTVYSHHRQESRGRLEPQAGYRHGKDGQRGAYHRGEHRCVGHYDRCHYGH